MASLVVSHLSNFKWKLPPSSAGIDMSGYYHEMFLRGKPFLARSIKKKDKTSDPGDLKIRETTPKLYLWPVLPQTKPENGTQKYRAATGKREDNQLLDRDEQAVSRSTDLINSLMQVSQEPYEMIRHATQLQTQQMSVLLHACPQNQQLPLNTSVLHRSLSTMEHTNTPRTQPQLAMILQQLQQPDRQRDINDFPMFPLL
jgi:hypothetical protein